MKLDPCLDLGISPLLQDRVGPQRATCTQCLTPPCTGWQLELRFTTFRDFGEGNMRIPRSFSAPLLKLLCCFLVFDFFFLLSVFLQRLQPSVYPLSPMPFSGFEELFISLIPRPHFLRISSHNMTNVTCWSLDSRSWDRLGLCHTSNGHCSYRVQLLLLLTFSESRS